MRDATLLLLDGAADFDAAAIRLVIFMIHRLRHDRRALDFAF